MTESRMNANEDSAVDDVRRVREEFSQAAAGDLRRHVEQTQAAFAELQKTLQLKTAPPPTRKEATTSGA